MRLEAASAWNAALVRIGRPDREAPVAASLAFGSGGLHRRRAGLLDLVA